MKISELVIRAIGLILAVAGLVLVLGAIGVFSFGAGALQPAWFAVIIGVVLIGIGAYIVRGGTITF